jgi:uncharacterized protein (DUF488 family)
MTRPPIFTIGHSDRKWGEFVETLQRYEVEFVVDVRTTPYSHRYPHFNAEALAKFLPQVQLKYVKLGKELGARRTDPHLLSDVGQVWYPKVRQSPEFKTAIARIEHRASEGHRIALLCMEPGPLECHRFPMIAYQLARDGFEVQHILRDDTLKTQTDVEADMLRKFEKKIPQPGLFGPEVSAAEQLEAAYEQLNLAIGWKP